MKLELKHLSPYLPYRLKLQYGAEDYRVMNAGSGSGGHWVGIIATIQRQSAEIHPIPILRPLSDLTEEIEITGKKFVPLDWFYKNPTDNHCEVYDEWFSYVYDNENPDWMQAPYELTMRLFEWHFDVFGLIKQGLAIDIKSLSQF